MDDTLFSLSAIDSPTPELTPLADAATRMAFGQFDTPAWAALALYDAAFGDKLGTSDLVWEFSCGRGAFLSAIPGHVPAFGSEIDVDRAAEAARRTGRKVLVGDSRTVELPQGITAAIGNPPFDLSFFEEGILGRLAGILKEGQRCASIVPAYFLQTARTVLRLNEKWTLRHEFIPRDLFPGLTKPILFGIFERDDRPHLVGFRLYREASEVRALPERSQRLMAESFHGSRSVWVQVFATVLLELGGVADLCDIYRKVEGRRPTPNPAWKEQLRKVAYERFRKVGPFPSSLRFNGRLSAPCPRCRPRSRLLRAKSPEVTFGMSKIAPVVLPLAQGELSLGPIYTKSQRWFCGRASYRTAREPIVTAHFVVEPISKAAAKRFVEEHHYSHSFPYEIASFGLFYKPGLDPARLVGASVFTTPSNPHTMERWCGFDNFRNGAELGRFVLLDSDGCGGNAETFFLSRALRLFKGQRPEIRAVLSYSDPVPRLNLDTGVTTFRGHYGSCYQSSNAAYLGRSDPKTLFLARSGEAIPARILAKIRNDEEGAAYSVERVDRLAGLPRLAGESGPSFVTRALKSPALRRVRHSGNHLYLFPLAGSRREKAQIIRIRRIQEILSQGLPYPKLIDAAA